MIVAKIQVSGAIAHTVYKKVIPAGIIGAQVEFEYAEDIWKGLHKTVVFRGPVTKDVVSDANIVTMPPEVAEKPLSLLSVGVYGVDDNGNLAIPTIWADLGFVRESANPSGDTTTDPALPVWAQIQAMIGNLDDLDTDMKISLVAAVNEAMKKGGAVDEAEIRRIVDEYLTANPPTVTETDPTVPAWAKQPQKPTYTAFEVGAISQEDLQEATNEALAQAKASGEFNGQDGKDGADGQDGITPTIGENGNWYLGNTDTGKPSRGEPGQSGADGQPGSDGAPGPVGATPNIQIGTVETLAAGSPATASMTGTAENPLLNLGIPKGADGSGEGGSGIAVTGATVVQTVKIAAVDENGVPTAWEAVDLPSGCSGGDVLWAYTVEETVAITATAFTPNIDVTALNSFSIRGKFLGASSSETGAEFFVNGNRMLKSGMGAHPIPYFVRKEGSYAEFDFLFRAVGSNKVCVFSAYNSPYRANSNDYLYSVSASDIGSIENVLESIGFVPIDENVTMVVGAGSYIEIVGWN